MDIIPAVPVPVPGPGPVPAERPAPAHSARPAPAPAARRSRRSRRRAALRAVREVGRDALALLWPTACVACGAPDRDCCADCLAEVRVETAVIERDIGVPCFAACAYEGATRALLVEFKHAGRIGFARVLGPRLAAPLAAAVRRSSGPLAPIVVAAPSRPSRVRSRGYRHVEMLLAGALRARRGAASGGPRGPSAAGEPSALRVLRVRALRARRGRTAQLGLDASGRERNARRVAVRASCRSVLRGREAIVVDDVVTTGATLRAAAEALESAGVTVIAAVALCAVPRRDARAAEAAPAGLRALSEDGGGKREGEHGRVRERRNGAPQRPTRPTSPGRSPWT